MNSGQKNAVKPVPTLQAAAGDPPIPKKPRKKPEPKLRCAYRTCLKAATTEVVIPTKDPTTSFEIGVCDDHFAVVSRKTVSC